MRRGRVAAAAIAALVAVASPIQAQEDCEFLPGTGNVRGVTIGQSRITYLDTPNLACADGVRIRADSAVVFESSAFTQLFGNVRFEDPDRRLRAREAQYFHRVGRLQAQHDVELVRKTDGSIVRGSDLVYLPAAEDRPDRLTVNGERASATLRVEPAPRAAPADTAATGPGLVPSDPPAAPTDTAAMPSDVAPAPVDTAAMLREPIAARPMAAAEARPPSRTSPESAVTYDVFAERIVLEGESGFVAVGRGGRSVEIVRDSLRAWGDSVSYDEAAGILALRERARMQGAGYDLAGEDIDVLLPGQDVREVVAERRATLTGEDVRLTAPRIRLFLVDGAVERLVAMPMPLADDTAAAPAEGEDVRARATAETFALSADSIEVLAPREVLERLVAVGSAVGESTARDSLNTPDTPAIARRDWIEGDTIVATFGRVATAPDSTATRLERLEAMTSARSLYRLEPSDSARASGVTRLAVHYVTGDRIIIEMEAGEVERMEVTGPARGLHLEPRRVPGAAPADTVAAPPADTVPAPPPAAPPGGGR
ncbi:MAG: hypothetical protein KY453_00255 [Gemmatimonadetes bacterium]|nr:hypothetical protein [Gemmatimonadota bacterium]